MSHRNTRACAPATLLHRGDPIDVDIWYDAAFDPLDVEILAIYLRDTEREPEPSFRYDSEYVEEIVKAHAVADLTLGSSHD